MLSRYATAGPLTSRAALFLSGPLLRWTKGWHNSSEIRAEICSDAVVGDPAERASAENLLQTSGMIIAIWVLILYLIAERLPSVEAVHYWEYFLQLLSGFALGTMFIHMLYQFGLNRLLTRHRLVNTLITDLAVTVATLGFAIVVHLAAPPV